MLHLKAAAAWLAAIHPSLPWVLLTVALWLIQYGTRKTKAGAIVWEWAANLPFPTDITPTLHVVRKGWQALPGTLAGALIGAVGMGGDYAGAALGALAGFAASVKHEAMKLWKAIPYTGATSLLVVPGPNGAITSSDGGVSWTSRTTPTSKTPTKRGDDDDTPPDGTAGGGLQGLPGAAAVILAIGLALAGTTSCGLFGGSSPAPDVPTADVIDRDAALRLAFNSSAVALTFLDEAEAAYLDALATPTAEQLASSRARVMRLKRVSAALELARDWLDGELPEDEGRKALADATELLRLAGDELESQGVKLPSAVRDGLAAAEALLGGAS